MRQAIEVMYSNNHNTAFIIEGFERKSVEIELIESKILEFFERLYGLGSTEIKRNDPDFIVTTKDEVFKLTWSWRTSYVANGLYKVRDNYKDFFN